MLFSAMTARLDKHVQYKLSVECCSLLRLTLKLIYSKAMDRQCNSSETLLTDQVCN